MMKDVRYRISFTAQHEGQLLRGALMNYGISKRALTAIKYRGGELLVNGVVRNVRHPLQIGDTITVIFPPEEVSEGLLPESGHLLISYEDNEILILEKPPFQSTIPSHDHLTGSIANVVAGYFKAQQMLSTVHVVTRLDRDTSGLMCIAKHRHIHHLLCEAQKKHTIYRTYEAIVHGHVELDQQEIIAPIGRKTGSIIEREVRPDGQFAHTDAQVLKRMEWHGQKMTHIRLQLHTGRTHQIRVHMAYLGHPLLGDNLYGGSKELINRQALHCVSLTLTHPITKEKMNWYSELPEDIKKLLHS